MPIGVPKVPFRIPGDEDTTWVDIYNRLYRARLLFLTQEITTEISNYLVGLIIYLSIEDQTQDLYLFINCPGGWVLPGIALFDAMQLVIPDVYTICMGIAASMGSFILVGGEITKRFAFPHARVMIHQPASSFHEGSTGECMMEAEELLILRETLTKVYAQRTSQPFWVLTEDLERDVFMSAREAQAHGIIDFVANEGVGIVKKEQWKESK
uniref:clp protease proteolytic subunit n=1 Tax=Koenigia islandica TaxID=374741 RepID=UPI0021CCC5BA|nr:clp protease proteolytic subunit [Koenigia islandica]UWM11625.1 clp protease proteolytic subunit [Koenigia islandica]UZP14289.1 clp protease proteolytic subunit [Koenigia islandica]